MGCLLLDIDFDEALRFVGEGYSVRRPHVTNHVFSVTSPDAEVGVHVSSMRYGLRFPPHDLIVQFLNFYRLLPGQLSPHSYYCFSTFQIKCHLKGVPWSLDLFRYMFKVSKIRAREGNSYTVVSSQTKCGMVVIPTSLKLWNAKFVFVSGFPGDRDPFTARFPECHTFIRHPRPDPTLELLAHAQKLLEDCRPKPPHVYTVCTKQNLAKVGILISLERQFELAEVVRGGCPKHGLEETASGAEEDEEIETDEESGQRSYSEDAIDAEPSRGNMHLLDVARKAKLLTQSQGREEEVRREPPSGDTSESAATIPDREVVPTRNQRKRKLIQAEEEETASELDVILTQSPPTKRPTISEDGKFSALLDEGGVNVQAEAEAGPLTIVLKDEGEILLSLQKTVDGFQQAMQKTVQGLHQELSRLRKLAAAEHETAVELEMQAIVMSEEVVRLKGLLRESEESASQLTASMAELERRLRQSKGRIAEMDVELASAL
ncbi:unnamed protein product [Cuscuta campestris]|uniref:Transposase (putative) gypsy type domain-containing protein n=1 Tax=Cuscuta campestris TaxID=132261 RepID=A0A484KVL6_9ASTE|nr:unnamed protein product [Cuscuta campestris]